MIIQSKKNQEMTWEVSLEEWEMMKKKDIAHRFKIISTVDLGPDAKAPVKPIEVVNFMNNKNPEVKKVYDRDAFPTRGSLKSKKKEEMIEMFPDLGLTDDMLKPEMIDKIMLYAEKSTESEDTGDNSDSSKPGLSGEPDAGSGSDG